MSTTKTSTKHFVLMTELEWTMARLACLLVHELWEKYGIMYKPSDLARLLQGRWLRDGGAGRWKDLESFGSLHFLRTYQIEDIVRHLLEHGVLEQEEKKKPVVLTDKGRALLDGRYLGATGFLKQKEKP